MSIYLFCHFQVAKVICGKCSITLASYFTWEIVCCFVKSIYEEGAHKRVCGYLLAMCCALSAGPTYTTDPSSRFVTLAQFCINSRPFSCPKNLCWVMFRETFIWILLTILRTSFLLCNYIRMHLIFVKYSLCFSMYIRVVQFFSWLLTHK